MLMRAQLAIVINKWLDDETNARYHKLVFIINIDSLADIECLERIVTSHHDKY